MSSSNDDTNQKDIVEDDLIDAAPIVSQTSQTVSPSSSQSSLSAKQLTNSYKSQSLQSMSQTKVTANEMQQSEQNNILISIVNSEEESDDDDHVTNQIKSKSLTQFTTFSTSRQESLKQSNGTNLEQESKQTRSLVILYGESDEENTQTNSYHNSSASNSTSYNSLNNINNQTTQQNVTDRSVIKRTGSLSQNKQIKSTSVGDLNKMTCNAIMDHELIIAKKINSFQINNYESTTSSPDSENEVLKDQLNLIKYELKEKDLDIIQLQKEINELLLDNKMLKARMPSVNEELYINVNSDDHNNEAPYIKELFIVKREKECAIEELIKAQDTISRLRLEKSTKSIDLYDPNNPEILHRKLKTYEKQIQDLEDENERCANEMSKMEKVLDKFKLENSDLKSMVNESRIYKEREEALILEVASLKNELKKFIFSNNQLNEENNRLIENINRRQEQSIGVSTSTQTAPVQQFEYQNLIINDDENELINRQHKQRNTSTYKQNQRQANSPNDYYSPQQQQQHLNQLNCGTVSSSSFENDNEPVFSNRINNKSTSATPTPLNDHHHQHSTRLNHPVATQNPRSNQPVANNYENQQNYYSLSRNDDYLISNFRPFNTNSTPASCSTFYQRPNQSITPYMGQLPTQSNTNSARVYNQTSTTYNHHSNQRTHTNNYTNSTANNGSSYNGNGYYRQTKDLDTSMAQERNTPTSSRHQPSAYPSAAPIANTYSRSNTVLNWKISNGMNLINDKSDYDDQDHYSNRRDHNAPSNTLQFHNKSSLCSKAFYSSSETILVDDENNTISNKNDDKLLRDDINSNKSNSKNNKSLKINVMRDLKSAQKLKSAFTNSKYSKNFSSFNDSPSTSPQQPQAFIKPIKSTNSFQTSDDLYSHHNQQQQTDISKDSFNNIKRSQTFSVSTNSYNKARSNTTSILPLQNSDLLDPLNDFNLTDNLSPTNSQTSFYNDSRSNYQQDLDIDVDLGRGNIYQRSKSADRAGFERRSKISRDTENLFQSSYSKDILARKRPFVPIKAEDIRQGDFIKFSRPGGKISKGMVKYIGPLPDRSDIYFGLELDSEEGKHDGIYQEKRYFQTKPNKGVFVSFSKVVMAWG